MISSVARQFSDQRAGILRHAKAGARKLCGRRNDRPVGRNPFHAGRTREECFQDELRRARENGRIESEQWYLSKTGSWVSCSSILSPLLDATIRSYANIARTVAGPSKQREDL